MLNTSLDFYANPIILKEPMLKNNIKGYRCMFGGWVLQLKYKQNGLIYKEEEDYISPNKFVDVFVPDFEKYRDELWQEFLDIFDFSCNTILS